jgi:hypothetical protein
MASTSVGMARVTSIVLDPEVTGVANFLFCRQDAILRGVSVHLRRSPRGC